LRTSVDQQFLKDEQTVLAYKRLAAVERAFRSLNRSSTPLQERVC
jgi:transposase